MTDYVIANGRASTYPTKHYGGHFVGSRATFCVDEDFSSLDANVLAIPNLPVTVLSSTQVRVLPNFFGMHVYQRDNDSNPIGVSFGTARSHDIKDGKGRWQYIETSNNVWDFDTIDEWVDAHHIAGRDIVFTLFGTPTWASARQSEEGIFGPYNLGIQAEPLDMAHWDRYCAKIATRYLGKIKYYEVWNEPNLNSNGTGPTGTTGTAFFFSGTHAKLSEMVRRANQTIKAIDPTAKVLSPPLVSWSSSAGGSAETYFTSMMAASDGATGTMKDWVDIVAVHMYISGNHITNLPGIIDRVDAAKTTAGVSSKETWDTESAPLSPEISAMTGYDSKKFIARSMVIQASKGISRTIYYQYDHTTMGINLSEAMGYREEVRNLLLNGSFQSVSMLSDGRLACYTNTGLIII